jgi:uncharacterized protein DUF4416
MRARTPDPVKLVVSVFTGDPTLFSGVFERLTERFGPIDLLSERLPFTTTDYYDDEFGGGLTRKVASFETLIEPIYLADAKIFTNGLEDGYRAGDKRRVNIDPGYMALEKFVLASCKNFSHRIYLKDGVWADLTLMYVADGFMTLPWTYPDYKEETMTGILKEIRKRYAFALGRGLRFG